MLNLRRAGIRHFMRARSLNVTTVVCAVTYRLRVAPANISERYSKSRARSSPDLHGDRGSAAQAIGQVAESLSVATLKDRARISSECTQPAQPVARPDGIWFSGASGRRVAIKCGMSAEGGWITVESPPTTREGGGGTMSPSRHILIPNDLGHFRRVMYPRLVLYAAPLLGDHEARTVATQALRLAGRHWTEIGDRERPDLWVLTVTARMVRWRRRNGPPSPLRSPVAEAYRDLLVAISALPPRIAEAVALHYLLGYRVSDIAEVLEIKEGTVKAYLHRGRAKLDRLRQTPQHAQPSTEKEACNRDGSDA